jgi:cold shock CspA family protein
MLGTVLRYDRARSYGFILADDENLPDYFVVPKFILGNLRFLMAGWRVDFTPAEVDGKYQAHEVRIIARPIAIQHGEKAAGRE